MIASRRKKKERKLCTIIKIDIECHTEEWSGEIRRIVCVEKNYGMVKRKQMYTGVDYSHVFPC